MQVGSDDDGYAVRLHCDWFMHYCSSNDEDHAPADDSPLYIFDGTRRLQTDIPKRAHFSTSIHAFMLIIVSTFLPFAALPHPFKRHYPPFAKFVLSRDLWRTLQQQSHAQGVFGAALFYGGPFSICGQEAPASFSVRGAYSKKKEDAEAMLVA